MAAGMVAPKAWPRESRARGAPRLKGRRSIAVLGFKNVSGAVDAAWLSTGLCEMLDTELGAGGALRVIPGEAVARVKRELAIADADGYAKDTLARVHDDLGADLVVVGSYTAIGAGNTRRLRVDVKIQDTSSGEIIASVAQEGGQRELFDLVGASVEALRGRIGVEPAAAAQLATLRVALPATPDGAHAYSAGIDALRSGEYRAARDRLLEAVAAAPASAMAESALAQAWNGLGETERARDAANRAVELSAGLADRDQLLINGRAKLISRDYPGARRDLSKLMEATPDDLDVGLLLAAAYGDDGDGKEELGVLARLRMLPPPAGNDPRIALREADAYGDLGESAHELEAVRRSEAEARRRGASLVLANALVVKSTVIAMAGNADDALPPLDEATAISARLGTHAMDARVLAARSFALAYGGDEVGAVDAMQRAVDAFDATGDVSDANRMAGNIVFDYLDGGNANRARAALVLFERRRDVPTATTAVYRDWLVYVSGAPAAARALFRTELADLRHPQRVHVEVEQRYANALRDLDHIEEARRTYGDVLRTHRAAHADFPYAHAASELAFLEGVEGRPLDEQMVRDLEHYADPATRTAAPLRFFARTSIAWSRLAGHRLADARREIDAASALYSPRMQDVNGAFLLASAALAVDDADGGATTADVARMVDVLAQATEYDNPRIVLEARLALALHMRTAGDDASRELGEIAIEAKRRGLLWIARRAVAAR
jgi:tetratricopeptide (TPR) repeat protein